MEEAHIKKPLLTYHGSKTVKALQIIWESYTSKQMVSQYRDLGINTAFSSEA